MAKSLRNKAKTAARSRKREEGEYQVHHAARLARLNEKLLKANSNKEEIVEGAATQEEGAADEETMDVAKEGEDGAAPDEAPKKISTSGPRNSRRESWREAKGMKPRATSHGQTANGTLRAKRKAGRPARRR